MLKLYLLGRPYVEVDGVEIHLSRRKNLGLLAYLARAAEPRRREELIMLFWPELDARHAQTALRRDLWVLRNTVGNAALIVTNETIGLATTDAVWCDASAFQQLVAANGQLLHDQQQGDLENGNTRAIEQLVAAVQLYRDNFMAGFSLRDSSDFDEWQLAQTEALRHDLLVTLSTLIAIYQQQSNRDLAISYAKRLLEIDPLHEPAHQQLMTLYAAEGRYAAALQQYERCAEVLAAQVGARPTSAMRQLYHAMKAKLSQPDIPQRSSQDIFAGRPSAPSSADRAQTIAEPPLPPTNLPTLSTPFIGRALELTQVVERLVTPDCRLLTLLGPGGTGKTRLAIEAARRLQPHYADGVAFVSLAGLRHTELLPAAILEALGRMRETDRSPAETLIAYLQSRHQLLVLDNFEKLRAGQHFVQRLLDSTEKLELLVTSRERINISAEWLLPLTGMSFPPTPVMQSPPTFLTDSAPHSDEESYDAITFFRECAGRIHPSTLLNPTNTEAIVQICQLVEGFPLAIELAAAWLPVMSCKEIVAALQNGLEILATTQSDVDARHRSMRAALDYSWQIATPPEQLVLARLSQFHGGFTLSLAQAVADADPLMVRTLSDKSWVHRLPTGRVVMHDLIRRFCAEKLANGAANIAQVKARHAHVYGTFLQQRAAELLDHRQVDAAQAVVAELDNVRAAWAYAVETEDVALLHDLLESFYFVGLIRNWHEEQMACLAKTLAAITAIDSSTDALNSDALNNKVAFQRSLLLARLHLRLAVYLADSGQLEQTIQHCQQGKVLLSTLPQEHHTHAVHQEMSLGFALHAYVLTMADSLEGVLDMTRRANELAITTHETVATVLSVLAEGCARFESGEQTAAIALLTAKVDALRVVGELWLRARLLGQLVFRARLRNEISLVKQFTSERLALCQQLGDQRGVFSCLQDLSYNALFCLDPNVQEGRRYMEQAHAISRALQNPFLQAETCFGLGQVAYFEEEWAQARSYFEEGYGIYRALDGQTGMLLLCHMWLGEIALAEAQLAEAEWRFGEVLAHTAAIGVKLLALEGLAKTRIHQGVTDPALAVLIMVERHPNTWEFARGRVQQLLDNLPQTMPVGQIALARQYGITMTLEEALAWGAQHEEMT